jgi:Zn-finger nucleic acid-binding protein
MDCPVCTAAMITMELNEVEIDHCIDCGGIWLDAGELEMLMENVEKATNLLESFQNPSICEEISRKCPICLKKMEKVIVGTENPPLLLDKCKKGDGLWFDSGELEDVCAKAKLDDDSKIVKLLADMFGKK